MTELNIRKEEWKEACGIYGKIVGEHLHGDGIDIVVRLLRKEKSAVQAAYAESLQIVKDCFKKGYITDVEERIQEAADKARRK